MPHYGGNFMGDIESGGIRIESDVVLTTQELYQIFDMIRDTNSVQSALGSDVQLMGGVIWEVTNQIIAREE